MATIWLQIGQILDLKPKYEEKKKLHVTLEVFWVILYYQVFFLNKLWGFPNKIYSRRLWSIAYEIAW